MRDTHLSLKLQLFKGRLFDAFKREKAELKAKSEDDSDEELEPFLINVNNVKFIFTIQWFTMDNTMVVNGLYPHKAQILNEFNSSAVIYKE